jgi:hypothetical protein
MCRSNPAGPGITKAKGSKLRVATDEKHVCFPGCHSPSDLVSEYILRKAPDSHCFLGRALSRVGVVSVTSIQLSSCSVAQRVRCWQGLGSVKRNDSREPRR